MQTTESSKIIDSLKLQIVEIQIRIAESRERGSDWAEDTRLAKIADLRDMIALFELEAAANA